MADWNRVKELQKIGIKKIIKNLDLKREYIKIYKEVFLSNLCVSCNAYIRHSFNQFLTLTKPKIKVMSNRKYILKDGVVLSYQPHRTHYTNDNLTDEIAKEILKAKPILSKYFEEMPEDEKTVVPPSNNEGPKDEVKTLSKMNTTELKVEVEQLEGIVDGEVETIMKGIKKEIVKAIKGWTPPVPEEDTTHDDDSPAVTALKQMDEAGLQKYAGDHEDKFPEWKNHELKEDLLAYLIENV